jgi:glycosyltransferase involved in cell wall biosynthesis
MKIAFDLRRIKNPGIGRYMKCLVEAVVPQATEHEYLLIMPPDGHDELEVMGPAIEKVASSLKYYSIHEQLALPGFLRRNRVDLLHSPHFNVPLLSPCPTVVTIHDVIYLACKEDLGSFVGRSYYRAMMAASVRLAKRIITDSDYSRRDIVELLNGDPDKIDVIYPGVDEHFQKVSDRGIITSTIAKYGISAPYILYTGIYKPRKNHAGLVRAFQLFGQQGQNAELVIAGPTAEGEQELKRLASELGVAAKVKFTGFVDDADLPALYSGARLYACASLYEGFGFTILEAMACGVPVVSSQATSLPEVAGDAALLADASNPEEFSQALVAAFSQDGLRADLIEKGFRNCQRFQWQEAARQTRAVYAKALRTSAPGAVPA